MPSNYHLDTKKWCALIYIADKCHFSDWFEDKAEAESELRCMKNNFNYAAEETMEGEGTYPERAIIMNIKYQESGRTNGLYTGLMSKDGAVSDNNSK